MYAQTLIDITRLLLCDDNKTQQRIEKAKSLANIKMAQDRLETYENQLRADMSRKQTGEEVADARRNIIIEPKGENDTETFKEYVKSEKRKMKDFERPDAFATTGAHFVKPTVEDINDLIKDKCDEIKLLLVAKNTSYAAALFNPINQFSSLSASETCRVLIDNKLSRLINGKKYKSENDILDLVGYLINLLVVTDLETPTKSPHA